MLPAHSGRVSCCMNGSRLSAGPERCWSVWALHFCRAVDPMAILLIRVLSAAGAICGLLYSCGCLWSAAAFHSRKRQARHGGFAPRVSVLKPLCGIDPHGYESLRSHCLQDYPNFEII